MKRIQPLSVLALGALLVGCAATQTADHATQPAVQVGNGQGAGIEALTGKTWTLVEIQSMDDSLYTPREGHSYTLEFKEDGQVQVLADCNRGFGSWEHTPPSGISMGPVAVTKMYCGDGSIDNRYLTDLSYVRSYVLRDTNLYLATMADGSILKFASAVSPSFDCGRAEGSVQELICSDAELAGLDRRLDQLYRKALDSFPQEEIPTLKATQRGWIKGRDECWKSENIGDCAREAYERRITELEIKTGSTMVPAPAIYSCEDGRLLTAYFYNETLMPALILGDGTEQHLLYHALSASGARYEGRNISFWSKGDRAQYSTFGAESVECVSRK